MAAPTPTPTHSAPPSTSPAPAQYDGTAAYATFMHNVLSEMLHELKAVRKELQDMRRPAPDAGNRKRKRPGPTPPCTLCRLSRTPCIAAHPAEACARCIRKHVECFDDDGADPPRVRHPPEDGADEPESEPEAEAAWPAQASPAKRVPKACAECHARKRKCSGGPNCGVRVNGVPGPSGRPSPHKPPRVREPCAECRGRKRRCIHMDPKSGDEDEDAPDEEEPQPPASSSHTPSRSPPPSRWHYPAPQPPPHWQYPDQHRPPYPAPFVDRPYPHPHPPPHPHGLHPHPHARLPPAPDMRHPNAVADPNHTQIVPQPPSTVATPAATPAPASATAAPAPAGRKGRACLACRKLKMRCVAPNEDGGPDDRCQRCERAGLECVYVDRKRRGPGGVFPQDVAGYPKEGSVYPKDAYPNKEGSAYGPEAPFDTPDARSAKKLKREGSPSAAYADAARPPALPPMPNINGAPRRLSDEPRLHQESSFVDDGPD